MMDRRELRELEVGVRRCLQRPFHGAASLLIRLELSSTPFQREGLPDRKCYICRFQSVRLGSIRPNEAATMSALRQDTIVHSIWPPSRRTDRVVVMMERLAKLE